MAEVPVTRHEITPNQASFGASWQTHLSDAAQRIPAGTNDEAKVRTIAWRGPTDLYAGRVLFVRFARRFIEGSPQRTLNFHIAPNDQGYPRKDGNSAWEAYTADGRKVNGVSSLGVDWVAGQVYADEPRGGLVVTLQSEADERRRKSHFTIIDDAACKALRDKGDAVTVEMEIGIGRVDVPTSGYVKAKLAGETALRVDTGPVNTTWFGQTLWLLWEGAYWSSGLEGRCALETMAAQLGRTRDEMLADTPARFGDGFEPGVRIPAGVFTYPGDKPPEPTPQELAALADAQLAEGFKRLDLAEAALVDTRESLDNVGNLLDRIEES